MPPCLLVSAFAGTHHQLLQSPLCTGRLGFCCLSLLLSILLLLVSFHLCGAGGAWRERSNKRQFLLSTVRIFIHEELFFYILLTTFYLAYMQDPDNSCDIANCKCMRPAMKKPTILVILYSYNSCSRHRYMNACAHTFTQTHFSHTDSLCRKVG